MEILNPNLEIRNNIKIVNSNFPSVLEHAKIRILNLFRISYFALRISLISFFIAGCTTLNPATGRNEFIMISTDDEVRMGQAIHAQLLKENHVSTDEKILERVERVGRSLAAVSDRQDYEYHFFVIEKDELNAFTVPGGNIYFYTGLLKLLDSDEEVAAVLAHEIGHCAARHTVKKFQAALGYNLIESIVFSQVEMGEGARQIASMSTGTLMNIVFSAYGRRDELEADRLGVKYMHLAGYDLEGMIKTLKVLEKESEGKEIPSIVRTHPYVKDRIKAVEKEIETVQAKDKISTEAK